MRAFQLCLAALAFATATSAGIVDAATISVITPQKTHELESAFVEKGQLWIAQSDLKKINGFELKPEGVCYKSMCIPLPSNPGDWVKKSAAGAFFNLSAFAKKMGQQYCADDKKTVFSFAEVPDLANRKLPSGKAPNFKLKDRQGKTVQLSDFRGKKVLLWTFASW